jgi:hypothetical protein
LAIRADFDDEEILVELKFEDSKSLECFPGPVIGFQHPLRNNKSFYFEFYAPGIFRRNRQFDRVFRDADDYNHNLRRATFQGYLSPDIRPSSHQVYYELVKKWSHDCSSHSECQSYRNDTKRMPKRIIDVQVDPPVLIDSVERAFDYITLSYCSKIDFQKCSLTSASLETLKKGINLKNMPEFFRDTVVICRNLQIRYLWVFDLCILQDEPADWAHQVSQLRIIFGNALFTISQYPSYYTGDSIFPKASDSNPTVITNSHIPQLPSLGIRNFRPPTSYLPQDTVTRGWQTVERLLSTAVLHYTPYELAWECRTDLQTHSWRYWPINISEKLYIWPYRVFLRLQDLGNLRQVRQLEKLQQYWDHVVKMLSVSESFVQGGRLIVVTILSQLFSPHFQTFLNHNARWIVGSWEHDLPKSLCWINHRTDSEAYRNDEISSLQQGMMSVGPSWSWTSSAKPLSFDYSSGGITLHSRIKFQNMGSVPNILEYKTTGIYPKLSITGKLLKAQALKGMVQPIDQLRVRALQKPLKFESLAFDTIGHVSGIHDNMGLTMIFYWDGVPISSPALSVLFVAESIYDLWMLVLAEQELEIDQELTYKRVGICLTKHQVDVQDHEVKLLRKAFDAVAAKLIHLI